MGAAMNARDEAKDKAAERRKAKQGANEHVTFKGYINFSPTDAQREHFREWAGDSELLTESLSDALNRGYSVSLKADTKNGAFMASASRWEARFDDAGYIHTERSSDPFRALAKLAWYMAQIAYDGFPVREANNTVIDEW